MANKEQKELEESSSDKQLIKPKKKFGAYQIISLIILIVILCFSIIASIYFVNKIGWKNLFSNSGREEIQEYIQQYGGWSKYVYIGIVFISVIFAFVPNNVVAIAGGFIFGFWESIALTLIGVIIGGFAAFGLARAFGRPLIYQMADKKSLEKIEKKLEGKNSILFILFMLIPFIPSDIVCYAAGLTKMKFKQYAILSILTRIPGTIVSAYMGGGDIPWWIWVMFFVVLFAALFVIVKYGKRIANHMRKKKVWAPIADTFDELGDMNDTFNLGKKVPDKINTTEDTGKINLSEQDKDNQNYDQK